MEAGDASRERELAHRHAPLCAEVQVVLTLGGPARLVEEVVNPWPRWVFGFHLLVPRGIHGMRQVAGDGMRWAMVLRETAPA